MANGMIELPSSVFTMFVIMLAVCAIVLVAAGVDWMARRRKYTETIDVAIIGAVSGVFVLVKLFSGNIIVEIVIFVVGAIAVLRLIVTT